jgi:serine protease Do
MRKLLFICLVSIILNLPTFAKDNHEELSVPQEVLTNVSKSPNSVENNAQENSSQSLPPSSLANIQKLYPSFADIVKPLTPAVVNIQTEYKKTKLSNSQKNTMQDHLFSEYFFDFFEQQFNMPFGLEEQPANTASGSGFIIDPSGLIVTNHHVIANAEEIRVKLLDDTEATAKLIGSDVKTDLALLKIESKATLPFVKFGKSSEVRVGDWIIAIGNPFGLGGTVTAGIISSKGRDIDIDTGGIIDNFLQTDAAINKGNSGGPMFNLNGEVIGVNTAIYSPSGMSIGIGFAIPSDTAQNIIEQLKKHGEVTRGTLDVMIQEITDEIAEAFGLKSTTGVLIVQVTPGGAGDKAGLKSGDVVLTFANQPVKNSRKLQILVAEAPINKEIKIDIIRAGKNLELTAKITKVASSDTTTKTATKDDQNNNIGTIEKSFIVFSDITQELRTQHNLPKNFNGVMVTKIGKYKNYGLKVGDIILGIAQQPIENVQQFSKLYEKAKEETKDSKKKNVILFIKRRNINMYIAFPLSEEKK